jgi:nitroimidazol reductase NimA-like FMN-containing flavoprotein (pyridoxamine 5'-phosphate oxidase superfamily)
MSMLECTKLLTVNRFAHLACAQGGQPYVVPIHYAYADNHLYVFSMPGKKIAWMRSNPLVSVQVHERGQGREWRSVTVDGQYEELPDRIGDKCGRDYAWSLLSKHCDWWEPGALKPATFSALDDSAHVFFRILAESISGREAKE